MPNEIDRRQFIATTGLAVAAGALAPRGALAEGRPTVVVVHGADAAGMLAAGLARLGGAGAFVKRGRKVTIKVNAAWNSRPDQAGNTAPALVEALIRTCKAAGASEVVLPENTCSPHTQSFAVSGIGAAAKAAGGRLYQLDDAADYREVQLPRGKVLKNAAVARDVLDTGCLINAPVAKSHGGAGLTISMKNWMGAVRDRRAWHAGGLDQCIADCSTLIRPHLIVVDATRIMLTNGPRGPGEIKQPGELILGTDPVAVDAYAATLFDREPFGVPHIKLAHELGIGVGDLAKVDLVRLEI